MTLGQKQERFTADFAAMQTYALCWAAANGYTVRLEECFRHTSATHGHKRSLHRDKLAGHLLLFRDGEFMTNSDHYGPLGLVWETMNPDNRWGGRFGTPDGVHFSHAHKGMA